MIALLLSLLLIGGVVQIYLGTKSTYKVTGGLSRLQGNTRFSTDMIARDIRMAGYIPCSQPQAQLNVVNSTDWWAPLFTNSIRGFENGDNPFPDDSVNEVLPGSDSILILRGGSQVEAINFYDTANNEFIMQRDLGGDDWVESGSLMIACDSRQASLFQAGTVQSGNPTIVSVADGSASETPGNTTTNLNATFSHDSQLANYRAIAYYIANSNSGNGNSLYRRYLNVNGSMQNAPLKEELIEGVDTMHLLYGLDVDDDDDGTIDRLYAGDLQGNLHVVNVLSTDPGDWSLASNRFILLKATAPNSGEPQPITTKPIVVNNTQGFDGVVVVVTTRSYFTESDAVDEGIQSIYGVFDETALVAQSGNNIGNEVNISNMTRQTLTNNVFVDATVGVDLEVRTISNNPIPVNSQGWYIDFNVRNEFNEVVYPGEKAVRALQLRNDVLFVNTIIPQPLSCDPAPGGFSLALDPQTGTAGQEVIFDINSDDVFDSNNKINVAGQLKTIVGTCFKSTPSDSTFFGDYQITQLSDTDIDAVGNNIAKTELIGRQAWREVEFK